MPFNTRRSSTRGTPRGLLGSSGAITRHSNSVSSYRRMIKLLQFGSLNHIAALEGIPFMSSWPNFDRCFQIMECADARLLQEWVAFWGDLIEFEIVPVVASAETREVVDNLPNA